MTGVLRPQGVFRPQGVLRPRPSVSRPQGVVRPHSSSMSKGLTSGAQSTSELREPEGGRENRKEVGNDNSLSSMFAKQQGVSALNKASGMKKHRV